MVMDYKLFSKDSPVNFSPLAAAVIVSLMASLFGVNLGAIFVYKYQLMYQFMLERYEIANVLGIFIMGSLAGVFLGGWIIYGSGRKSGLLCGFLIGLAAHCTALLSPAFSTLLLSEFAAGGAFGIYLVSAIIYISEISHPSRRGLGNSLIAVFLIAGIEISLICGEYRPRADIVMVSVLLVAALVICLLTLLKVPESPRWLAMAGFTDAALAELYRLRQDRFTAARELAQINDCCKTPDKGLGFFLHSYRYRRLFWLLMMLSILLHLSGFCCVPYISFEFLEYYQHTGGQLLPWHYNYNYELVKSAVTVALFGAVSAAIAADRMGRIASMFISASLVMLLQLILSAVVLLEIRGINSMLLSVCFLIFIYASSVMFFVFLFVFVCEMLPLRGRELGMAGVMFMNLSCIMVASDIIGDISVSRSLGYWFLLFFLFTAVFAAIVFFFLPDTNDFSLERLEEKLLHDFNG